MQRCESPQREIQSSNGVQRYSKSLERKKYQTLDAVSRMGALPSPGNRCGGGEPGEGVCVAGPLLGEVEYGGGPCGLVAAGGIACLTNST